MFRNPVVDALVVLVVVLLFFGPKRLPALGQGLREFKDSIVGGSDGDDATERPAVTSASTPAATEKRAPEPRT